MRRPVVWWRPAFVALTGVILCVLLLLSACDNPAGSENETDDVVPETEGEDEGEVTPSLYSITYLGNGAVSGEPPVDTGEYGEGQRIEIAPQGDLRGAHVQDGITQCVTHWTTEPDGSGDAYVPVSKVYYMPNGDLTLYAQWSTDTDLLGKTGPTGGWIFYADTEDAYAWDYLEAAPEDIVIEGREEWQWGAQGINTDDSFLSVPEGIGEGLTATNDIVSFHDSLLSTDETNSSYYEYPGDYGAEASFSDGTQTYTFNTNNDGTVAAKLCTEYTALSGGVTYEDWFLPSEAELAEIYANLWDRPYPRGVFEGMRSYWSTNGYSNERAKARNFDETGSDVAAPKSYTYRVRPVRRF